MPKDQARRSTKSKPISFKVVFKIKRFETPIRFKARVVCLGYMQSPESIGYSYAPTSHGSTPLILSCISASLNLQHKLGDVHAAFLLAALQDMLLGGNLPGVILQEGYTIVIAGSLYGLVVAPHKFANLLKDALIAFNLKQSE